MTPHKRSLAGWQEAGSTLLTTVPWHVLLRHVPQNALVLGSPARYLPRFDLTSSSNRTNICCPYVGFHGNPSYVASSCKDYNTPQSKLSHTAVAASRERVFAAKQRQIPRHERSKSLSWADVKGIVGTCPYRTTLGRTWWSRNPRVVLQDRQLRDTIPDESQSYRQLTQVQQTETNTLELFR